MTLLITNDDVARVISMESCIEMLEQAFVDLEVGKAADRPRARTFTHMRHGLSYMFSSMDGSLPRHGVHGIRLTSGHVRTREPDSGNQTTSRQLPASGPGDSYVGLIMIFSLEDLVPLAILHDSVCNRYMVGATSAIAAKYLARAESHSVGLIGTGWLAGAQLLGLSEVRPIDRVKVAGRSRNRKESFCKEWAGRLGIEVLPVDDARAAVDGVDIIACATNSYEPVLRGAWLEPGQHVGSVIGWEIDYEVLERAFILSCRSVEQDSIWFSRGPTPLDYANQKVLPPWLAHKNEGLGEIILGRSGRRTEQDITFHGGGGTGASSGLGIQELAVAYHVYREVAKRGLGREVPTEWFLETSHP